MSLWTDEPSRAKHAANEERAKGVPLTDDERAILSLIDTDGFKALRSLASARAAFIKSTLYHQDLSGREFATGRVIGEGKTLEWLIQLPSELLERQRRNQDGERKSERA